MMLLYTIQLFVMIGLKLLLNGINPDPEYFNEQIANILGDDDRVFSILNNEQDFPVMSTTLNEPANIGHMPNCKIALHVLAGIHGPGQKCLIAGGAFIGEVAEEFLSNTDIIGTIVLN